ncbi:hypothetical protein [Corynebacterium sp. 13CS0277]|uniref:hypothetical protein n=1 Tax=Corynebacterium sp. 13CS0277 TaxID=2071994 RepID=UPI001304D0C3|nr:hypothetical protein [Corynebacterium sp. 13CS0277]
MSHQARKRTSTGAVYRFAAKLRDNPGVWMRYPTRSAHPSQTVVAPQRSGRVRALPPDQYWTRVRNNTAEAVYQPGHDYHRAERHIPYAYRKDPQK